MLRQTDKALSTPLPRVFDTEPTTGKPVPSAPAVMGTENENVEDAVRIGTLNEIAHQTGTKMEQEVLAPMEQWLRLFQVCRSLCTPMLLVECLGGRPASCHSTIACAPISLSSHLKQFTTADLAPSSEGLVSRPP